MFVWFFLNLRFHSSSESFQNPKTKKKGKKKSSLNPTEKQIKGFLGRRKIRTTSVIG